MPITWLNIKVVDVWFWLVIIWQLLLGYWLDLLLNIF